MVAQNWINKSRFLRFVVNLCCDATFSFARNHGLQIPKHLDSHDLLTQGGEDIRDPHERLRACDGQFMARYKLWFHDRDKKGQPLDENIIKTAESIAPAPTRYRQHEIDCEGTSNDKLQSTVEAASRASGGKQVQKPPGYLTQLFKRIVDKFLDREQKLVPVDDGFLEDLTNAGEGGSFEDLLHNHILLERLINAMDDETRQICNWRLEGYSEAEIAKLLNTTPNALSVRYTRGLKKATRQALSGNRRAKTK
jgi:DNA-directed RNA polymerase specialized sigma24 family protein